MLNYLIPLLSSFLPFWRVYLIPVLALSFIAWVGVLLHSLFRR